MANEAKKGFSWGAVWTIAVIALLVGGLATYSLFPKTVTVEKEVTIEKPVQVIVEKPVITEVEKDYAGETTALFLDYLAYDDDFDDYLVCDGDRYDFDQISVSKVYDGFKITFDNVDDEDRQEAAEYKTEVKLRLKYSDPDVRDKCYETLTIKGTFHEDKDPTIKVLN